MKGNSSHFVNHELHLDAVFAWQAEYGVVSFGAKQLDMVVKYAKNQQEHHAERTIIGLLEQAAQEQEPHGK